MTNRLQALREERAKIFADARTMVDAAEAEGRTFTDEEESQYDAMLTKADEIRTRVEREEALVEEERKQAQRVGEPAPTPGENRTGRASDEYGASFANFLARGATGIGADEYRALQVGADISGGYIVAPEQFVNDLLMNLDNLVFIRGLATKFQVPNAQSLGVPTLDADPADAAWTTELGTGDEDSTMAFGKRALYPSPLAKRIKVSNDLLRMAIMGAEALVRARLDYKFAVTEEKAFLTGSGSGQPLGIYTASADGISTGRDVSTGNTATAVTFDGLIEAKYTLKAAYWGAARWNFHRDAVKMIAKLKDGEGQYLWRESVRAGEPDRILGLPVDISEYTPNTFTTGLYVGMLGDYSHYWIADALDMTIKRLDELYAATNQVGFIGRKAADGMPVLEEAFVRVKLG